MREKRFMLKVEDYLSPVENASPNRRVLVDITVSNNLRKRSMPNKKDVLSAQDDKIITLDGLEIAYLPMRRASTARFTTPSSVIARSVKR